MTIFFDKMPVVSKPFFVSSGFFRSLRAGTPKSIFRQLFVRVNASESCDSGVRISVDMIDGLP